MPQQMGYCLEVIAVLVHFGGVLVAQGLGRQPRQIGLPSIVVEQTLDRPRRERISIAVDKDVLHTLRRPSHREVVTECIGEPWLQRHSADWL